MIVLRSALFNVCFFGLTIALTLGGAVVRAVAPHRVIDVARLWARLILAAARAICGIRVEVTGLEHIPDGPALIASHHESAFDTLIWFSLIPRGCYVLKHELLRIPVFGWLITATPMIPVDRAGGGTALRAMLRSVDDAVRARQQIVIFPEGTRAAPGTMLPLQPGVVAISSRTGLPVIPVATDSGRYWGRRAFHKHPGTIRIVVRPPLPPGMRRDALLAALDEQMRMDDPASA